MLAFDGTVSNVQSTPHGVRVYILVAHTYSDVAAKLIDIRGAQICLTMIDSEFEAVGTTYRIKTNPDYGLEFAFTLRGGGEVFEHYSLLANDEVFYNFMIEEVTNGVETGTDRKSQRETEEGHIISRSTREGNGDGIHSRREGFDGETAVGFEDAGGGGIWQNNTP